MVLNEIAPNLKPLTGPRIRQTSPRRTEPFAAATHVAHVALQLRHTVVLRRVEDHREVGEVLLGLHRVDRL